MCRVFVKVSIPFVLTTSIKQNLRFSFSARGMGWVGYGAGGQDKQM